MMDEPKTTKKTSSNSSSYFIQGNNYDCKLNKDREVNPNLPKMLMKSEDWTPLPGERYLLLLLRHQCSRVAGNAVSVAMLSIHLGCEPSMHICKTDRTKIQMTEYYIHNYAYFKAFIVQFGLHNEIVVCLP